MTYNVLMGTLNPTHSLTHSLHLLDIYNRIFELSICINLKSEFSKYKDILCPLCRQPKNCFPKAKQSNSCQIHSMINHRNKIWFQSRTTNFQFHSISEELFINVIHIHLSAREHQPSGSLVIRFH